MELNVNEAKSKLSANTSNPAVIWQAYERLFPTGDAGTVTEAYNEIESLLNSKRGDADSGLTEDDFVLPVIEPVVHPNNHPVVEPKKRNWWPIVIIGAVFLCLGCCALYSWVGGLDGVTNFLAGLSSHLPGASSASDNGNDNGTNNTSSEDGSSPTGNTSDGNALDALVDKSNGMMSFGWEEATWIGDGKMNTLVIATNALNKTLCVYEASGNAVNFTSGMIKGNFVMANAPEADFIAAGNEADCDTRYYIGPNSTPSGWGDKADGWGIWVNEDVYQAHNDTCAWPKENGYNVPFGTSMTIGGGDQTYFQGWNEGSVLYRFIVKGKEVTITTSEKIEGTYWNPSGCSFEEVLETFNTMNEEQVTNFVKNDGTPVILNIYIGDGPVPAGWTDVLPSGVTVK